MRIPMSAEIFSGIVRWPVFLLAYKVYCLYFTVSDFALCCFSLVNMSSYLYQFSTALSIAKDFKGKDGALFRKIKKDKYMYSAVTECYESLKYILQILVVGNLEKRQR